MTWAPVGHWDARLRTLGTVPGRCPDRELTTEVFADGTVTVVDGAEGLTLVGVWRVAGPGRVVICIRSGGAEVEGVVELSEDGQFFTGRTSIRGGRPGDPSGSGIGTAEVIGWRQLLRSGPAHPDL